MKQKRNGGVFRFIEQHQQEQKRLNGPYSRGNGPEKIWFCKQQTRQDSWWQHVACVPTDMHGMAITGGETTAFCPSRLQNMRKGVLRSRQRKQIYKQPALLTSPRPSGTTSYRKLLLQVHLNFIINGYRLWKSRIKIVFDINDVLAS